MPEWPVGREDLAGEFLVTPGRRDQPIVDPDHVRDPIDGGLVPLGQGNAHMVDTLETASVYHMQQGSTHFDDIDELMSKWSELSIMLNALNRSMGLEDAYPFILSQSTLAKLRFVHGLIYPS